MIQIIEASSEHLEIVRELFLEYAASLEFDLSFQGFYQELTSLPGIYSRPDGCILIAMSDSQVAGCVAFKPIDKQICEMKRLFVRPKFQGRGIGRALTSEILNLAKQIGYKKLRLDTVPSMTAAIEMYKSMGFYSIPPYRENPVPDTSYLEKLL